jgi:serine phosphatase RsbU (regulator of sigma subunit)
MAYVEWSQMAGPTPSPTVERMRVAARYIPADPEPGPGGDWYLSAEMPGGDLLLSVGDVEGHGAAAAPVMTEVRQEIAGYAATGCPPAEILAGLNEFLCAKPGDDLATAVVARFDPYSGELTWSRAGHLPILLANREGVAPLDQPSGAILGVWPDTRYGSLRRTLSPGDVMLMYTDGFVERPGGSVDDGVQALGSYAWKVLAANDRDRPDRLVRGLRRRNPRDDACALAAERLPRWSYDTAEADV